MRFIVENGVLVKVKGFKRKNVVIPSNVTAIGDGVFKDWKKMKSITIPEGVTSIGVKCFDHCTSLEEITLPNSVKILEACAFEACSNLKKIELSNNLITMGYGAITSCSSLEEITIPGSVTSIKKNTIAHCDSLKKIIISNGVTSIKSEAFSFCESLEEITIPRSVINIGDMFTFSTIISLKKMNLGSLDVLVASNDISLIIDRYMKYFYINPKTKEVIVSKEEIDGLKDYEKIDNEEIIKVKNDTRNLYNTSSAYLIYAIGTEKINAMGNFKYIVPKLISDKNIFKNGNANGKIYNYDRFNLLLKQLQKKTGYSITGSEVQYFDIFNLAYSLGAFENDEITRQKACEFISTSFDKGYFNMNMIHGSFESLVIREYNKELSEFIMNKENIKQLMELESLQTGYIARVINSFEGIREFGMSNRGDQHYRKVTVEMAEAYLKENAFIGVDNTNVDIAKEIGKFTRNQGSFDEAVNIRKDYDELKEKGKINDHILGEELKENDIFTQIEKERENILNSTKDTLTTLNELANKKFTYEFLSKHDPKNFVLGKYCSCCAHLEGVGIGIMKASIIHPDCQNLVIRDSKGEIIAKSTLYVNREQGYGVFNNVEINNNVIDEKTKKEIYDKYKEAVNAFARRYNEINKDKPIKQINVGMNLNDLSDQIKENNMVSNEILEGIHFSAYYGKYDGDWQGEQYIVWQNDKKEEKKNGR